MTIPVTNEIQLYFHCCKCIEECPPWKSPKSYQRIRAGWTELGLQIWCVRHDRNIIHVDFVGNKVRINTLAANDDPSGIPDVDLSRLSGFDQ